MNFENKLVAILNKDIETGVAMNALAHMVIGLGGALDKNDLKLDNYKDKNGNVYPNISQMPFIILRGKSTEIKKAVLAARENNIHHGVFLNTMTGGTFQEQIDNTAITSEEELSFYGAVLFGKWDIVSNITKKFSLYK
jgi:hypothetical protein